MSRLNTKIQNKILRPSLKVKKYVSLEDYDHLKEKYDECMTKLTFTQSDLSHKDTNTLEKRRWGINTLYIVIVLLTLGCGNYNYLYLSLGVVIIQ